MSMESISKRQQYESTRAALWMEKASFDPHWKDLADFVKPKRLRAYVSDRNKGDRRNRNIIDSTATLAHRTQSSGMHAGMSSPARPWFKLTTADPSLAKFGPVKAWLYQVTLLMLSAFQRSNVYTALPMIYGDMGLFASAACGVLDDEKQLFRCYNYPIGTYAFGISRRQIVDTFIREYQLTVRQLIDEFGREDGGRDIDRSRFSPTVLNLWDKGNYEALVDVCWMVTPNVEYDENKIGSKYLPFHSCHFEKGANTETILRESGFHEFPILAPRWEVQAEDIYGTDCPGMTALGDIRGLQTMVKRKAQGVEKLINPSLQAPVSARPQGVTLLPGGVNYVDQGQSQGIRPVYELRLPIGEIREDIADIKELIRRAFYEDLFLMLATTDRRDMTAREVAERHDEKLIGLGPVLERSQDELHEPLIDRVYPMMQRAGEIPPWPKDLEGVNLKIEYTSILSQAQKLLGASSMDYFMQTVANMAQTFPQVVNKVNPFPIVDRYGDAYDVPPDAILSDEDATKAMQQQQQMAIQQHQAEVAATMARGARDMSAAVPSENARELIASAP